MRAFIFLFLLYLPGQFSISPACAQKLVTLTIDTSARFQKMEGFGAFNSISAWKGRTPEYKYDFLVHDLGLSVLRFELPPTFQKDKDSAYDLKGAVFGGPDLQQNFKDVRELHKRGVTRFIASVWSPPAWMKTLNEQGKGPSLDHGGSLREDAYADFADYCAAFCRIFREQTGIDLYAIGLQNEPEFPEPYNSCVYTPAQLRETLRYVGRKFMKEHISTRIYLPEALPAQRHLADYFNAINDDPETKNYSQIFAIHNYDQDGINVGGAGSLDWQHFSALASSTDPQKQVWMTETSGHPDNWDGALLLAANIYNAIEYGNLSAWLWWSIADTRSSAPFGLIIDGKPTGRYYASRHFYRYVRPGAIRVACHTDQADVLSLAFTHSRNHRLVVVLINKGKADLRVVLPHFYTRHTPQISLSTVSLSVPAIPVVDERRISLPGKSIATLTWD